VDERWLVTLGAPAPGPSSLTPTGLMERPRGGLCCQSSFWLTQLVDDSEVRSARVWGYV
jgi:hypothetical protein